MIKRTFSLLLAVMMVIFTMTIGLMPVTAGSDNGITTDTSAPYGEYEEILKSKEKEQADSDNTGAIQSHRDSLYTKTTDNSDGTQTLEVFGSPVKYVSKDGSVRDISLRLTPDGSGFRTEDHYILAEFPEKAGTGIRLNTGDYNVTLTPVSADGIPVETEPALLTDPGTVAYRKDSKTSYEYSITYDGYKENIVVSEYTEFLSLADSHLRDIRHEVVWNTVGIFTDAAGLMCADGIEVS